MSAALQGHSGAPPAQEWRLEIHASLDSTNAEAVRRAHAGEPAGLAVLARAQTSGRGRDGRTWSTGAGDLAVSVLLRPPVRPPEAAGLSFVAAVAAQDFAAALLPEAAAPSIKWPNDVMIGPDKLAGVLLEAAAAPQIGGKGGGIDWLVIGIGVNLGPAEGRPDGAVDLVTAGAPRLEPEAAARGLLGRLGHWLDLWRVHGFPPIRDAWRARARDLGRPVRARLPNETVEGVARDLAPDGALVLVLADGRERRISAGDVFPIARND